MDHEILLNSCFYSQILPIKASILPFSRCLSRSSQKPRDLSIFPNSDLAGTKMRASLWEPGPSPHCPSQGAGLRRCRGTRNPVPGARDLHGMVKAHLAGSRRMELGIPGNRSVSMVKSQKEKGTPQDEPGHFLHLTPGQTERAESPGSGKSQGQRILQGVTRPLKETRLSRKPHPRTWAFQGGH